MSKPGFLVILIILIIPAFASGQGGYSGRVIDTHTKSPVPGAEIAIQGTGIKMMTDAAGHFSFATGIDERTESADYEITTGINCITWRSDIKIDIRVYSVLGQYTDVSGTSLIGSGDISLGNIPPGIYLLTVTGLGESRSYKIVREKENIHIGKSIAYRGAAPGAALKIALAASDTLVISKEGYYSQKWSYSDAEESYELLKRNYIGIDYLDKLIRPEAYTLLQGLPLNQTFGEVKSVKVVYSINDDKIYYSNSEKYFIHYDFCAQVLGYNKGHSMFNKEQYTRNANRLYILASLNHFTASDIYTLEFFAGDELDCGNIETVYNKVAETSFIGDRLRFYTTSTGWEKCTSVPIISSDELYQGQNYQALNPEIGYGYLRKVEVAELPGNYVGKHDIVLLNGIPIDISVVAGIITTEFQTPLSHINVLSHNRGTPNMALRDGWTNPTLNDLVNKLVYLKVSLDSFFIREATLSEAQLFWAQKEPKTPVKLDLDTLTTGLVDLSGADVNSVSLIGGKAANFAELTRINVTGGPLPLPEGYFAIPFYYYHRHIKKYGLDLFIDKMLKDPLFQTDIAWRQKQLGFLQDSIKNSPIDPSLLTIVKNKVATLHGFSKIRFRSSTNAEDIEGFNGAGLYDSYTGTLTDPDKPIDSAIKKVWASLWNFEAFEEREYFKIDQKTVAMGILVHRSYPDEAANGVVITKNLYNAYNSAITINVQAGEISVVSPGGYLPDQIIYYTFSDDNIIEYISHSDAPMMEGKTVMTAAELKVLKDYCLAIHYHYCRLFYECKPLDIEFKVDVVDGQRKIYIKQARLY